MFPRLDTALLPTWAEQLASILPLSALIEFIDIGSKLHVSQLTGSIPPWQWPVTPSGARLLFSVRSGEDECALDHAERSAVLECFDTRHGDAYPSSTPTTTRLWANAQFATRLVGNARLKSDVSGARPQKLTIYRLRADRETRKTPTGIKLTSRRLRSTAISALGWLCWATLVMISLLGRLWYAAAYLILVVLSGLVISNTHGRTPRSILNSDQHGHHDRLIVATSSRNSVEWKAFYGESVLLNGLLNRPLLRRQEIFWPRVSEVALQALILGQWLLVLASSSRADWNAYFVTFWIILCSVSNVYLYSPTHSARDWLRHDCHVSVSCVRADLSSRRAMLGALMYLSPDSSDDRTAWMDTILSKSSADRAAWERAVLEAVTVSRARGAQAANIITAQQGEGEYWRPWVAESTEMGARIEEAW